MASITRTPGDFEATQAVAIRSGSITARIITYAGNPNGATITPTPTLGTICIDSTTGEIWQFISGTTWQRSGTTVSSGLDWKNSCRVASTANIANLTSGAPNSVDGVTLAAGDRVLVKNQTTASQNGIYTVTTVGTGSNGVWARATDADTSAKVTTGMTTLVEQGAQADTLWILTTTGSIVLDTTALTFTSFGTYTAGSGISITNGVVTAVADPNGGLSVTGTGIKAISADSAALSVSSSGIGITLATTSGLSKTAGLAVVAQAAGGINVSASGIGITVAQQAAGTSGGLAVSATGIGLSLDATPGLQTTSGLKVLANAAGAISVGASGLAVNVDSTNNSTAIVSNAIVVPGSLNKTIAVATATQVVDSIPIATYGAAKWTVCVKNGTTGRYASEIVAVNLGTGTTVDYAEYGVVQVGSFTTNVPTFTVTSDGTNMILTFTGDAGNTITATRQAV